MRNENLKHCRICFSNKLTSYLDLGKQPFSNSFLNYKDLKNEKKFPLKVVLCKHCGLSQLSIIPNTKFIFSKYDYLSSSSKALSNHYKKLVKKLVKNYDVFSLKKQNNFPKFSCCFKRIFKIFGASRRFLKNSLK